MGGAFLSVKPEKSFGKMQGVPRQVRPDAEVSRSQGKLISANGSSPSRSWSDVVKGISKECSSVGAGFDCDAMLAGAGFCCSREVRFADEVLFPELVGSEERWRAAGFECDERVSLLINEQ